MSDNEAQITENHKFIQQNRKDSDQNRHWVESNVEPTLAIDKGT